MAENKRMQAKLWLSLYFLKKFGIKKLNMDPKIDESQPSGDRENQE